MKNVSNVKKRHRSEKVGWYLLNLKKETRSSMAGVQIPRKVVRPRKPMTQMLAGG